MYDVRQGLGRMVTRETATVSMTMDDGGATSTR